MYSHFCLCRNSVVYLLICDPKATGLFLTRKSIGKIFGFYYKILFLRKIVKITETITTSKFLRS